MSKRARLTGPVLFSNRPGPTSKAATIFRIAPPVADPLDPPCACARGISLIFRRLFRFDPCYAKPTGAGLPRSPDPPLPERAGHAVNGSVLVVDDDIDTAQLLRDGLRRRGLSVNSVHSARECL